MTKVNVHVAGEMVIRLDDLPTEALGQIQGALTIPNEEREKAAELRIHGWWDMPEQIALWRQETRRGGERVLCLPRGFAAQLATGAAAMGIELAWDDQRSSAAAAEGYYRQFALRDYQLSAASALLQSEQGFYRAPAGSGKTVTILGMLAYANQRALVIVDKAGLLEQWRTRAAEFYGFPMERDDDGKLKASLDGTRTVGKIGEDVWEERDLTICLRQTLHARGWSLDATGWWASWGATIHDEGHHLASETLGEISRKTVSKFHLAVSATPHKSPAKGALIQALIGPIVHETTRKELYEREVLMQPRVEVVNGSLEAAFWPDHEATFDNETKSWMCLKPDCRKQAKHSHRNNYSSVLKMLVEDEDRNLSIAERIMRDRGHVHLVPSRQLKHLDLLAKKLKGLGWPEDKIWMLRGAENADGLSQQIADAVLNADEAVVFSTVADEGLDIPPIDRVHIAFPMRQEAAVIQLVGRGERIAEGKTESIIVDYNEPNVSVFAAQFEDRYGVYLSQGFKVRYADVSDLIIYKDDVENNGRRYTHPNCLHSEGEAWIVPLDDAPAPMQAECPGCTRTMYVISEAEVIPF